MTCLRVAGLLALALSTAACGRHALRMYPDAVLGSESVNQRPHLPGLGKWHVLETGSGLVLDVFTYDPGEFFTMDDERCNTVLVEVPGTALGALPARIDRPASYLRACSCTWPICREESAQDGTAIVRRRSTARVDAELNLRFPSQTIRVKGTFRYDVPSASLLPAAISR